VLEDRHLVVLLSNTSGAPLAEMERGVLDVLYRRPPASPQLSVAEEVAGVLSTKGLDAALARQRALASGPTAGRAVSESELIALGRDLLRQGQTTAGVAILRQVTESSPTSAPAWDALGDALAAAGEKNEAVRSYAKSLQLEPGDTHALERLTALAKP
jgi:Flp pilus assembly protein TadD